VFITLYTSLKEPFCSGGDFFGKKYRHTKKRELTQIVWGKNGSTVNGFAH
jgi:hypothetical protein